MPQQARLPLPPSLYSETAAPGIETSSLRGDALASVAIIGAGYTGLSAALHLAECGIDAIVLETHEPGWGASGRNGGQVNPGFKLDPERVERDFGPERGPRLVALAWNAPRTVFELIERHCIACEAEVRGTLRAAGTAHSEQEVRNSAEQVIRRGFPARLLDRAATTAATGADRYRCGLLFECGGAINPLAYTRGLARAAAKAGARICGGTPVLGLRSENGRWLVRTRTGDVRADHVIVATNGYTDDLVPGLRRSIIALYSAIVATAPLPDDLARIVVPARVVTYEVSDVTVYYRVDSANRLLIGGRSISRDLISAGDCRFLVREAERLWPALSGAGWTHGWNGRVAVTTDQYPHLHEPAPGLHIALGYNGRGIAMATVMGEQLCRRIMGASEADLALPITPIRPIPGHRFWRLGVAVAITRGRLGGWLAR
jgi:glycine/D-amino acid oxidase-like deaminating enzyme